MSRAPHAVQVRTAAKIGNSTLIDLLTNDGLWCAVANCGMGEFSDQANHEHGITRAEQDTYAHSSHRKATAATESGRLKQEISALTDILGADEGIRPGSKLDKLASLQPAFSENGSITAGNASQMSDAGAAGVLMSSARASELGLTPHIEVVDRVVVAGPDPSLHLKPAAAAHSLLTRNGLNINNIGLWEINEAFAGVVLASSRNLGLDPDLVNVNGGAIALGHPLAASGFRMLITLAN